MGGPERARGRAIGAVRSPMTIGAMVKETAGSLRGQKVAVAMIGLLVAAMCATVVISTGRAEAAQRQVAARVEAAGSRQLIITDQTGGPLASSAAVTVLAGATGVEAAAGIGTARDVTNGEVGPGGTLVTAWPILGNLADVGHLTRGRWPQPGEALASDAALRSLGLDAPVGWVIDKTGNQHAVVGSYTPQPGFDDLDGILIAHTADTTPTLRVIVTDAGVASGVQSLALSVLDPPNPSDLRVTSPTALAALEQLVSGDLGAYARTLTAITLGSATLLIAIVVLSQVLLQRRDIGRRRALGAPRWAVITLIIGQAATPALVGAILGTGIALIIGARTGATTTITLATGAIILGVLAAAIAAILPATIAAWRDPVRVLRTP